jgi:hypothetical protein
MQKSVEMEKKDPTIGAFTKFIFRTTNFWFCSSFHVCEVVTGRSGPTDDNDDDDNDVKIVYDEKEDGAISKPSGEIHPDEEGKYSFHFLCTMTKRLWRNVKCRSRAVRQLRRSGEIDEPKQSTTETEIKVRIVW